jgi:hypothetical protein
MKTLKCNNLLSAMKPGVPYRRQALSKYSGSVDRDLAYLMKEKKLRKVGPGLYLKPQKSRFGALPPDDHALVSSFLKKGFLMFSRTDYNKLGLGLTQTYNEVVVYNHERHLNTTLGGRPFSFQRPSNGFPKKLSKEFLLVDLLNNLKLLTEDVSQIHEKIKSDRNNFDLSKLYSLANEYGKVSTRKFITQLSES